jgi:Arc/MetJ-type ribon-helix-helix transcriptional regulator
MMRTTRVYSFTLPPEMAVQVERLAKKEHRTMSELVREALRRYQRPNPAALDTLELIRRIAPAPAAFQAIREEARRKGVHSLSMREIDREVAAVRQLAKRKAARPK